MSYSTLPVSVSQKLPSRAYSSYILRIVLAASLSAGLKAAISLGVYSRDTQRNVRFTETEIKEFLNAATGSQSGYGTEKDEAQVKPDI